MAIIYPGGRPGGGMGGGMMPWPYRDDDDGDDGDYDMGPMMRRRGGPRGWYPGGGFYPPFGPGYGYGYHDDWSPSYIGMGGHHNILQCWPPMPPKPEKKKEDEKKGPSNKKAFFLVRQKNSKSGKDWKGYCDHMPAKSHVGKASHPFWYMFT